MTMLENRRNSALLSSKLKAIPIPPPEMVAMA